VTVFFFAYNVFNKKTSTFVLIRMPNMSNTNVSCLVTFIF